MNTTQLKNVSPLPRPTWGWLHINSAQFTQRDDLPAYSGSPLPIHAEGFVVDSGAPETDFDAPPAIVKQTALQVKAGQPHTLRVEIPENAQRTEPLFIDYKLDGEALTHHLSITARAGSSATVVLRIAGSGAHAGYTSIQVEPGARLRFVAVQLLDSASTHLDGIAARVAEAGDLHLILGEAGGGSVVAGCDVALIGQNATAQLDSLYFGVGQETKDLNYRIEYAAPQTEGAISAHGALAGAARKTFKSTIDFKTGATGAKGRESENVLVLGDKVVNISTPLLLCGEDNVEGQHATSIGRPDPGKLYYLMTRGFTKAAARRLLIEAAMNPVLRKISLPALRDELLAMMPKEEEVAVYAG